MGRRPGDPVRRFWSKVEQTETCWLWRGTIATKGYGAFKVPGHWAVRAHRYAYEMLVGPIPEGMVLDHLCRVRHCVNPAHLEVVTSRENVLRGVGLSALNATKTHCRNGHAFDERNTAIVRGARRCRSCLRIKGRERYRLKVNASALAGIDIKGES